MNMAKIICFEHINVPSQSPAGSRTRAQLQRRVVTDFGRSAYRTWLQNMLH